jgi:Zn finger protein HypA/HybF involved in hydrogenase expression
VIYCPNCQVERVLKSIQQFCCPVCGSPASEVIMGRELQIVAMEIEDACPQLEREPAPV